MNHKKIVSNVRWFLIGVIAIGAIAAITNYAYAGGSKPVNQQHQGQVQGQAQAQIAEGGHGGSSKAVGVGGGGGQGGHGGSGGTATNEGIDNTTSISSNTENNSSNVVLVPNNNTESCIRVWGLAFGKNGESGALGVPWRSARCDYEQAADDAFAAGERELGWFWKCRNKSLYRVFRKTGMTKDQAMNACHRNAVGHVTSASTIQGLTAKVERLENQVASHNDSMNRVAEECRESADRAHHSCVNK